MQPLIRHLHPAHDRYHAAPSNALIDADLREEDDVQEINDLAEGSDPVMWVRSRIAIISA